MTFTGCERRDEQIKVYRLVKPTGESTPMENNAVASTNAPVKSAIERVPSAASNIATPPNWEAQPLSQMRQASFLVHGENGAMADVSFVSLGPAAGNVLENVNRWLGQLAQPPITADQLASTIQKLHTLARRCRRRRSGRQTGKWRREQRRPHHRRDRIRLRQSFIF